MKLVQIPTPALLLDLDVFEANTRRMQERADSLGVRLRPHVKTHKCVEAARIQREVGARGITVSTLEEARTFADAGFEDITWAFPVIPGRIEEARELSERVRLGVLVDGPGAIDLLERTGHPFRVWLKVDCGYGRAGVDPATDRLRALAEVVSSSPSLRFEGLLTHSGQAYAATSVEGLAAAAEEERRVMSEAAARLRRAGLEVPAVSVGSTPAMSRATSMEGVTEARPGNYALYDYTQVALGACEVRDCAATVLTTVISSQPGAEHCVVDAGALALSKDPGPTGHGDRTMGRVYDDYGRARLSESTRISSLSQEHGKVTVRLPHGTRLRVLPNHSCLTVACFDEFHVVRGEEVVDRWRIRRAR